MRDVELPDYGENEIGVEDVLFVPLDRLVEHDQVKLLGGQREAWKFLQSLLDAGVMQEALLLQVQETEFRVQVNLVELQEVSDLAPEFEDQLQVY